MKKRFKLSHSLIGTAALLLVEWLLLKLVAGQSGEVLVCVVAAVGSLATLYVSTEVIEEVRSARHMLVLLAVQVAQQLIFYAFQYAFLLQLAPVSFPTLVPTPINLLLHSTMVFVFNPLYQPITAAGQALLLINTLGALGLVLFVLQNVWQFRRA